MRMKNKTLIAAAFGLAFVLPQAEAALYNFSYTASYGTLAGTLDGTLQPDNNTVVVSAFNDFVTLDGVPQPSLTFVHSYDFFLGFSSSDVPTLTLDGSALVDLIACNDGNCGYGFAFGVGSGTSANQFGGVPFVAQSFAAPEPFNAANWSLTPAAASPVPELDAAGAPLALAWLAGVLALARRKAA